MAKYDPFAVRSVLGPDWIISHDGEDYADGKHNNPPAPSQDKPPSGQPDILIPTAHPYVPHAHLVPYRTAYTTGPKLGVAAVCFLGLAVFFVVLPSSTLTLSLGGFFFFMAFGFMMAIGCCCVPVNYNTTINHNGNTGSLPPYIPPVPFAPAVLPVFRV